jgi:cell division protein FtsI/penicillin-binding protein 2
MMGFFSFLLIAGLLVATLWRVQQLQDDINALKTQNERIIKALEERAERPATTTDNSGEEL